MSKHKTNAARFLDNIDIEYEILEYEFDENHLDALSVAQKTGGDIKNIYKTILCVADERYIVACIRGDLKLDLKALARASESKRCELLELKELTKVSGYLRGGCSPIAMKRSFETYIDSEILTLKKVLVSAGIRGKQLKLSPKSLIKATNAKLAKITHEI